MTQRRKSKVLLILCRNSFYNLLIFMYDGFFNINLAANRSCSCQNGSATQGHDYDRSGLLKLGIRQYSCPAVKPNLHKTV